MNLEMPTPAETESLRKLLLIVLGVMIVTIPVIGILVIAKIKAKQRAYRPPGASDRSTGVPPVSSKNDAPSPSQKTEGTQETAGTQGAQGSPDILSGSSSPASNLPPSSSSEPSVPPHA